MPPQVVHRILNTLAPSIIGGVTSRSNPTANFGSTSKKASGYTRPWRCTCTVAVCQNEGSICVTGAAQSAVAKGTLLSCERQRNCSFDIMCSALYAAMRKYLIEINKNYAQYNVQFSPSRPNDNVSNWAVDDRFYEMDISVKNSRTIVKISQKVIFDTEPFYAYEDWYVKYEAPSSTEENLTRSFSRVDDKSLKMYGVEMERACKGNGMIRGLITYRNPDNNDTLSLYRTSPTETVWLCFKQDQSAQMMSGTSRA